ncbi:MAG TPA: glycosyltransferase [Pseudonocardiaceae bacterium]|jgi:UDP:flavonoid glycosyltransferase YjiC (YdhE family)|nr:glycosyltransferase [Pseudonocardiaceae bacterium]
MKVLIIAAGSRGDVAPPAGLGARLVQAGHDVIMAADKAFAAFIEDVGMEFRPLIGDIHQAAKSELHSAAARDGMASRSGARLVKAAKRYFHLLNGNVAGLTAGSGADVVMFNPFGSAAYHVAQALGIPSIGMALQPHEPTAELPPIVFGRSLGRFGNRATGRLMRMAERMYFTGINNIRVEHGLPPTTFTATQRAQFDADWPVKHGFSHHVVPRPKDWRPGLDVVGYWWPPMPTDWTPPQELSRFLDAGPAPVFIGLGSTNPADGERLTNTITAALRKAGQRGIIQAGWAKLSTRDDDMLTIGDVPHEWLFPRTRAVVHAAGAGTTAAGLRAGVPAVPIPVTGDGPFWSHRLTTLGVSPGPVRIKRLTTDRLTDAVHEAITNPAYRTRARELAAKIATEDGAAQVAAALDSLSATA